MSKYTFMEKKWFAEANPLSGIKASINWGAGGANGAVIVKFDYVGLAGNVYSIEAVEQVGNNLPMGAVLTGTKITVTLGTDAIGANSVTSNTALLLAAAINALDNITATYSGTGETPLTTTVVETVLSPGRFATAVYAPAIMIISGVVYVAENPVTPITEGGWTSGTLS